MIKIFPKHTKIFFVFAGFIFLCSSCSDESITPVKQTVLKQIAGCNKLSLNKSGSANSCFSYSFKDNLILDFCVSGNCCPDKDRYILTSGIVGDSIFITIKDTAQNLCRCNCNYIIHSEFFSLPRSNYIVKCIRKELPEDQVIYLEQVNRN